MSLDKAINSGKEHRKQYRGSARFDPACRNGACGYCHGNKLIRTKKAKEKAKVDLNER